jgi:hypothetical protein
MIRRCAANPGDQALDMSDRRIRQNAVAEIENKRSSRKGLQNRLDCSIECISANQQRERIKVTLHRPMSLNVLAGETRFDHPIETDRVDRDSVEIACQLGSGPARKSDDLCVRNPPSHSAYDLCQWIDAPFAKFLGRQYARPTIEDLHRLGAGLKLANEIFRRSLDQQRDQFAEGLWMPVSEKPRRSLVRSAAAGDHIGRHRPWRATEPNECDVGRQLWFDASNSLVNRRKRRVIDLPLQLPKRRHIDERIKPRSLSGFERDSLTERMRHDQNIRKQNRRIKAEAPNRLQRHLGRQLRIEAEVEKRRGLLANGPVFRQIPARLAHEPDRRDGQPFIGQDAKKGLGVGCVRHESNLKSNHS